jgi:excisionase family DNA binding protein
MEDEILNSTEAAEYLKISRSFLTQLAKEKKIPSMRLGRGYRFTRTSLNNWINRRLNVDEEEWLCHNK